MSIGKNVENKLWDIYSLPYSHAKKSIFRPMTVSVSKQKCMNRVSKRGINENKDSTAVASASTKSIDVNNVTIVNHDSDDSDYEDDLPLIYVSRWNKLRSSSTAPFFGRSTSWSGGEAFGWCKEQYSTVRECCSMFLSNYGSRTCRHYVMAPPPTLKSYKYSSPFGLGEIQSVWCTSDWQPRNCLQTSDSAPGHPSPLGSVEIPRQSLQ